MEQCPEVNFVRTAIVLVAMTLVSVGSRLSAQTKPDSQAIPVFDVVSIKENSDPSRGSSWNTTPDGMSMKNTSLDNMIHSAFGLPYTNDDQVVGLPPWAKKEHFDVAAKVAEEDVARYKNVTDKQQEQMMKGLLIERFHLSAHLETKQGPIYELLIAKGGPKLTEAKAPQKDQATVVPRTGGLCAGCYMWSNNEVKADTIPMETILNILMSASQRVVVDKTGLTGKYTFVLKWTPAGQADAASASQSDTLGPSLFAAVQEQMGLRLNPSKGPVEYVVVDHVDPPSAN